MSLTLKSEARGDGRKMYTYICSDILYIDSKIKGAMSRVMTAGSTLTLNKENWKTLKYSLVDDTKLITNMKKNCQRIVRFGACQ